VGLFVLVGQAVIGDVLCDQQPAQRLRRLANLSPDFARSVSSAQSHLGGEDISVFGFSPGVLALGCYCPGDLGTGN
jgi:hypothetical protein